METKQKMAVPIPTKSKQAPWIPPGIGKQSKHKKLVKPIKKDNNVLPKTSPVKTTDIPKEEAPKEDEPDVMSLSSHSSAGAQEKPDIHLILLYQEVKLLYVHFESLKASYLSSHRLINSEEIEDSSINEYFIQAGVCVKELNSLFSDLEYSVTLLENTLDEIQKTQEYSKVYDIKQNLLSKLLEMYEKVIIIFQSVFEKQDFKEMSQLQDCLSKKLQLTEKKYISQEAVVKDLERRLSIYQSKASAIESYKSNLESAKAELEKQLMHKESQIKYLSSELLNASGKQTHTDREEFIEIIENINHKAQAEKSALKKALKLQRAQSKQHEANYQKLIQETNEKEKIMFEIAAQRDQLKVQLTVINNSVIQQRNQIEEMKIQNLKLQNEMAEKDVAHKKTMTELQNTLEEKLTELSNLVKSKARLEKTVEELENELQESRKHLKNRKDTENQTFVKSHTVQLKETDVLSEEIRHLVSLLQDTKKVVEALKQSYRTVSAGGDHVENDTEFGSVQNDIFTAVKDTKQHLLQLEDLFKTFLQEHKELPRQKGSPKSNDLEKRFKKLEKLYNETTKENEELKQEVEELRNLSATSPAIQKTENYFTTNVPNDNFTRKLQVELYHKSNEIIKMKHDFQIKERDLEDQLKECKNKVRIMEVDSAKISSLEEELKSTKLELFNLQKKKEEEADNLQRMNRDLQDALDLKTDLYEGLQRYVQLVKSSYFNVFGES